MSEPHSPPTCAVLDDYQGVALSIADWSAVREHFDVRVLSAPLPDGDAVVDAVGDCTVIVAMRERTPFPAKVLSRLPNLRLLVTTGMRNMSIDLHTAVAQGVTVCGTSSSPQPPVELTWALLLGLARHLKLETQAMQQTGPWQQTVGTDLFGRRLGVLGLGKTGSLVARIGQAFGMHVSAWSENLTTARTEPLGVALAPSKLDLLSSSDFCTVHLVLSDRTRGLIGAAELRAMPSTAFLVNTSRAAIIDEAALLRALSEGEIAGVGLDVFETEPLPADSPWRTAPRVLSTPHLGYVTVDNYRRFYEQAIEDVLAFVADRPLRVLLP